MRLQMVRRIKAPEAVPRGRKETVDDLLKRARYAREKAESAAGPADKEEWLEIAREWDAAARKKRSPRRKKAKAG